MINIDLAIKHPAPLRALSKTSARFVAEYNDVVFVPKPSIFTIVDLSVFALIIEPVMFFYLSLATASISSIKIIAGDLSLALE